jgi:glutamate-1-semialdehyde aminotransferase
MTANQILSKMVSRTIVELDRFGVKPSDRHDVLTLASIVEKEVRNTSDFYKASRVFTNRLETGMPLQSDATVSFGVKGSTFTTSKADRADANRYAAFRLALLHRGVYVLPDGRWYVGAVHGEPELAHALAAIDAAMGGLAESNP